MTARWSFDAIGVPWSIDTPAPLAAGVRDRVAARIARFDRDWSRFRDDSLVARMARTPGAWRLPDEAGPLLDVYRRLHGATGGRMSPLVGDALAAYGFDGSFRLRAADPGPAPSWADALAWDADEGTLTMVRPATLDVGAAGKGLLVDLVGEELEAAGVPDAVVDASGDLRILGSGTGETERVALEHPDDPTLAIGVVVLGVVNRGAGALAGSATNRRAWGDVHHVLDATTGTPVRGIRATWAVASTGLVADAAATALFFAPGPVVRDALGEPIEWIRVDEGGRVEASPGLGTSLFPGTAAA